MEEDDNISDLGFDNDDQDQQNEDQQQNQDGEQLDEDQEENKENTDKKEKKKRKVQIFRFKPTMLMDKKKGLEFLYKQSKKLKLQDPSSKDFKEADELKKLLMFTKEWHFYFMPKYDYNYFIDRCQFYGEKKPEIKGYLDRIRRCHKGQMRFSDIEDPNQEQQNLEQQENQDQQEQPNQQQNQAEIDIAEDMTGLQIQNANNNNTQRNQSQINKNNNQTQKGNTIINKNPLKLKTSKETILQFAQQLGKGNINSNRNSSITNNTNNIQNNKTNNNNNQMQEEEEDFGQYEEFQEDENYDELIEQDEDLLKEMMQDEEQLEREANMIMQQQQEFIEQQIQKDQIGQSKQLNKLTLQDEQ